MNKLRYLFLFFFAVSFFGPRSWGRITDNKIDIKILSGKIEIKTMQGFHLNAEAPASAVFSLEKSVVKPIQKTEKIFTFKTPSGAKKARLSFYVCDDKKTVCEQHQREISLTASARAAAQAETTNSTKMLINENLSTELDIDFLKSRNGKPTLLVFSAPWCPACIRLQTETYLHKAVSEQLLKVNFLKFNIDLPENHGLSEKFHVKAIPTLVLLNVDGDEVFRWLDFQQAEEFAKALNQEVKNSTTLVPKSTLLLQAQQGQREAQSTLGRLYYNALDCAEAIRWLSFSEEETDKKLKLAAEVQCSQENESQSEGKSNPNEAKKASAEYLKTLEKAILLTSSKIDKLRWLVDYIEKRKELNELNGEGRTRAKQALEEINLRLKPAFERAKLEQEFKQSTYGEASGFEFEEMQLMASRLYGALQLSNEKAASDQKIIESLTGRTFSVDQPGALLLAIAYLREAGERKWVTDQYKNLIGKYPDTYVYYEKFARFLLKEKNSKLALENVEQALRFAEGNQPQLLLLKARILQDLKRKTDALRIVDQALQVELIQHPRYKKTLAQLNKLRNEIRK